MSEKCTCPWVDPSLWTTYGSAVEPGSQREFDPECPEHGRAEDVRRAAYAKACGTYSWHRTTAHFQQTIDAVIAIADTERARVWDEAYGDGVADAWQSMDFDGGQTPAARANPYRPGKSENGGDRG